MLKRLCLYTKIGRAKLKVCLLKPAFRVSVLLWRPYKRNGSIPTAYSQRATYNIHQSIRYRKANLLSYYTSPLDTPNTCNMYCTYVYSVYCIYIVYIYILYILRVLYISCIVYNVYCIYCFKLCYVAVCLVYTKLQDPFSNLLRVAVQRGACLDFHLYPVKARYRNTQLL